MSVSGAALRELHRIHRQLSDIRERLERGPKQVRGAEANVKHLEEQLAQAQQTTKMSKVAADQKQLQLKTNEGRILDTRAKLNSCGTNREYQALLEQIAAAEMANSVLSDEILEMLEKIDECEVQVGEAKTNLEKGKQEMAKLVQRVGAERQSLESDLARLQNELVQAEAALPADFKVEYHRVVKARGEQALAVVDGECCGGCNFVISPQMMNDLYMSRPVFCKSCGALLYLAEDRGVGNRGNS